MAPNRITVDINHFLPFEKPGSTAQSVLCKYYQNPKKGSFVRSGKGRLLAHLDACEAYKKHLKQLEESNGKPLRQASIEDACLPIPKAIKSSINAALARSVILSGSPFNYYDKVTNPHNYHLLTTLRPGYEPPSRKDLSTKWLDTIYMELKAQVDRIAARQEAVNFCMDESSSASGERIWNLCFSSTEGTAFHLLHQSLGDADQTAKSLFIRTKSNIAAQLEASRDDGFVR